MKALNAIGAGLANLIAGFCATAFVCVAVGAVAVITNGHARIPGLFFARTGEENGALAIEFIPNFTGMVVLAAALAIAGSLLQLRGKRAAP